VGAAENGKPEYLANVLYKLYPAKLEAILTNGENKVLKTLVDAAGKNPEHLVKVLGRFDSEKLKAVLADENNGVLNTLARTPKDLDLVNVLYWLDSADLVEVLKIKVDGKAIGERNLNFFSNQKFIEALKEAGFPD
jgi:hypothetical protein